MVLCPKQIIFEGPDRVGKDSQINLLLQHLWNDHKLAYNVSHYSHIKNIQNYQEYSFELYQNLMRRLISRGSSMLDIYNRSHLGEYVYANLYRDYSGDYVFDLELSNYLDIEESIFLITLIDDPNTLIERDDHLSFSNSIEQKKLEISLFEEAHNKSIIQNKILINCSGMNKNEIHELIKQGMNI